jgi:hypothetical protein
VATALSTAGVAAACGGGGDEISAPPVSPAPTSTLAPPAPSTSAPPTTTAPTTTALPSTTAAPATTLTPELEAELVDVYTNARRVLYEAFLDPPNADLEAVARYWTPEAVPGWADLIHEWAAKQWRFEPGPGDQYHATVNSIELASDGHAILRSCVVTDAAVHDMANASYIDPGVLSSYFYTAELKRIDGVWRVAGDEQGREFRDVAGCDS